MHRQPSQLLRLPPTHQPPSQLLKRQQPNPLPKQKLQPRRQWLKHRPNRKLQRKLSQRPRPKLKKNQPIHPPKAKEGAPWRI
jgi:hypothetical protein